MVQLAQLVGVLSPCCKACSAVATIVESTDNISSARTTIVKTAARRTGRVSLEKRDIRSAGRASDSSCMFPASCTFMALKVNWLSRVVESGSTGGYLPCSGCIGRRRAVGRSRPGSEAYRAGPGSLLLHRAGELDDGRPSRKGRYASHRAKLFKLFRRGSVSV